MSVFCVRLPVVSSDPNLVTIPQDDIEQFIGLEVGAYEHWVFDVANSSVLTGKVNGRALSPITTAPTYSVGSLSMSNLVGRGLATNLIDSASLAVTLCAVVRMPAGVTSACSLFGTANAVSGASGFLSYTYTNAGVAVLQNAVNPGAVLAVSERSPQAHGLWTFVGVSLDVTTASKICRELIGGDTGSEKTAASYTNSTRAIALGNGYYTLGAAATMEFAEFVVFDRSMSVAEMQAVYVRRKTYMAERGISVV